MADLTGKILANRYRVDSFIGRGGMAEVYKVWDRKRAVFLAMKLLNEDLALDKVFIRRFTREAQTLEQLTHPNIVRFYGLERDGPLVFILMDFIEGVTLKRLIFQRGIEPSIDDIRKVFRGICGALTYAHGMGFVHCDIKPSNILIDHKGDALLADFGIARMVGSAGTTLDRSGTPAYMSPEQSRGLEPTPLSDIYTLGIILYEMITGGERPFTGEKAEVGGTTGEKIRWEKVNKTPTSPRQYNPNISTTLEQIILKCIQKDPVYRYQSALEMFNDLERALSQQPFGSQKPPLIKEISTEADEVEIRVDPEQLTGVQNLPLQWIKEYWDTVVANVGSGRLILILGVIILGLAGIFFFSNPGLPKKTRRYYPTHTLTIYPISSVTLTEEVFPSETLEPMRPSSTPTIDRIYPSNTSTLIPTVTPEPVPSSSNTPRLTTSTPPSTTPKPSFTEKNAGYISPTPKAYYPLSSCADSRVRVGDSVFVAYGGGGNFIREDPDVHASDNVIGKAYEGDVMVVVDGPECSFGWILWKVSLSDTNLKGWIAESDGDEFWLDVIHSRVVCSSAPKTRLHVGDKAHVGRYPDVKNNVRNIPGIYSTITGAINPSTQVVILEGPECMHGIVWWKIRTTDDRLQGWTGEGDKNNYWLIPEP